MKTKSIISAFLPFILLLIGVGTMNGFSRREIRLSDAISRYNSLNGKIITVSGIIEADGYTRKRCPIKSSLSMKLGDKENQGPLVYLYSSRSRLSSDAKRYGDKLLLSGNKIRMKIMRCLPPYSFFALGNKYKVTGILKNLKPDDDGFEQKHRIFFDVLTVIPSF